MCGEACCRQSDDGLGWSDGVALWSVHTTNERGKKRCWENE